VHGRLISLLLVLATTCAFVIRAHRVRYCPLEHAYNSEDRRTILVVQAGRVSVPPLRVHRDTIRFYIVHRLLVPA
jgi:hypothetical protein